MVTIQTILVDDKHVSWNRWFGACFKHNLRYQAIFGRWLNEESLIFKELPMKIPFSLVKNGLMLIFGQLTVSWYNVFFFLRPGKIFYSEGCVSGM